MEECKLGRYPNAVFDTFDGFSTRAGYCDGVQLACSSHMSTFIWRHLEPSSIYAGDLPLEFLLYIVVWFLSLSSISSQRGR